jgi:hypothetical protein
VYRSQGGRGRRYDSPVLRALGWVVPAGEEGEGRLAVALVRALAPAKDRRIGRRQPR